MAEIGLRFNVDAEEVELTVDGNVVGTSGSDRFAYWVQLYNQKHTLATPLAPEPLPAPVPVVEPAPAEPVTPPPAEPVPTPAPAPEPPVETPPAATTPTPEVNDG